MAPNNAIWMLAFILVGFGTVDCFSGWCDSENDRRLEQLIETALSDIPRERTTELHAVTSQQSPLGFEGYKVTGLNQLHRTGPLRTYCGNGSQVINFDLTSQEPIFCSFHWTAGGNGSLDFAAHGVRVRTQVKFVEGNPVEGSVTPRRVLDEHEEPLTTTLRVARVTLHIEDPSGDRTRATSGFPRHLAMASIQDSWEDVFVPKLLHALKEL